MPAAFAPSAPAADPASASRLADLDAAHVWHPFTPMSAHTAEDIPCIVEGDGFDLIDDRGRRYLDGISSLWCNVHGHRVPELDAAIADQLGRVAHTTLLGLNNDRAIELAARLAALAPGELDHVFYSDSGSTAVEAALKIAWQYHRQSGRPGGDRRDVFLTVSGAYHGDTIGSVSLGAIRLFHQVYGGLLFDTVSVPSPGQFPRPDGLDADAWHQHCFEAAAKAAADAGDRLAGIVIEPLVQGAAGIWTHPAGYLKHLRTLANETGALLIADEVAVGFGRTGSMLASEQESVTPDLLCLAKGLTGGYLPLAATLATSTVYEAFLGEPHEGRTFFHGHTFTGNPLACAAAIASLDRFASHDVLGNAAEVEAVLRDELAPLADHPHVADVRQRGIMVGIELATAKQPMMPFDSALRMGHRVTRAARRRGVIVRPLGDVVVLMPAPAMPPETARRLVRETIASIDEAVAE